MTGEAMTETEKRLLLQGLAMALGPLAGRFDQPTLARSIMDGYGFTVSDLKAAGVIEHDLKPIRKAMQHGR